ncbi:MAG: hypothetical protein HXS54_06310 [Theionarchaea archaeon]|nr:hypothetical protein [Theionarchaea archaeon]DBA34872.1 TPA_asm: hypothetical protein vir521_00078 [Caudoviricetes sp. vir521]
MTKCKICGKEKEFDIYLDLNSVCAECLDTELEDMGEEGIIPISISQIVYSALKRKNRGDET